MIPCVGGCKARVRYLKLIIMSVDLGWNLNFLFLGFLLVLAKVRSEPRAETHIAEAIWN